MFNSNYHSLLHRFWHILISKNTATLKSGSRVTQGHRNHLIVCLWFPVSVLQ